MEKNICGFNISFLKQVNNLMEDSNILEIEMEEGDTLYLRVTKKRNMADKNEYYNHPSDGGTIEIPFESGEEPNVKAAPDNPGKSEYDDETRYYRIKSPVIGTFYEAPSPQSPPYIKLGDTVSEDTTVCIVEAMKIMNEIKADVQGRIIEIFKTNGSPVQSGDPLYLIELM
jgi:acetyl-CoA carboxylase biotin carboxyl carrier protein